MPFQPISGVPGPCGFLRGCISRARGPELSGDGCDAHGWAQEGGAAESAAKALPRDPGLGSGWCPAVTPLSSPLPAPVSPRGRGWVEPFALESAALC